MEKKQAQATPKTSLKLRTETLRRLDDSNLRGVVGGARIWKPLGFVDDTTPSDDTTTG